MAQGEGQPVEEKKLDVIKTFPHCDVLVLHAPGTCQYCDAHPEWQQLRQVWRINFTGRDCMDRTQCPAEARRGLRTVHAWPGNRPDSGHDTAGEERRIPRMRVAPCDMGGEALGHAVAASSAGTQILLLTKENETLRGDVRKRDNLIAVQGFELEGRAKELETMKRQVSDISTQLADARMKAATAQEREVAERKKAGIYFDCYQRIRNELGALMERFK